MAYKIMPPKELSKDDEIDTLRGILSELIEVIDNTCNYCDCGNLDLSSHLIEKIRKEANSTMC